MKDFIKNALILDPSSPCPNFGTDRHYRIAPLFEVEQFRVQHSFSYNSSTDSTKSIHLGAALTPFTVIAARDTDIMPLRRINLSLAPAPAHVIFSRRHQHCRVTIRIMESFHSMPL